MRANQNFRNVALTVVVAVALAVCAVVRALAPLAVQPKASVPNVVLLSLIAILLDHYLSKGVKRCGIFTLVASVLTFGLLPFAAGFAGVFEALKLAIVGGVVFTLTAWIFTSVQERLTSGPAAKATPVFSALGLYLAAQCFSGMIL